MAKKPRPEGKKYSYMDTYGDLVTLLMCFFVLLFAMSSVDEAKYNAFVEALTNRFGSAPMNMSAVPPDVEEEGDDYGTELPSEGDTLDPTEPQPAELQKMAENITQYLEENNLQGDVSVEVGESGATFIRLSDNLLFAGNSSALQPAAQDFLSYMGSLMMDNEDNILQVDIMGHTGSIPGSTTDDWMLGSERAGRVTSFLERSVGFSPYKMHTEGYGRLYPIADNSTAEGLAKNRRVDMVIVSNDAENLAQALAESSRVYFPSDDTQFFEGAPEELPGYALDQVAALGGLGEGVDLSQLSEDQMAELYGIFSESQR